MSRNEYDFIIIGGGPAGLSASAEAASHGVKVLLIDENDNLGGQLFTQTHKFFGSKRHKAGVRGFQIAKELVKNVNDLKVEILVDTIVWGIFPDKKIALNTGDNKTEIVFAKNVLIATGGLEKPVLFPGWTLPGVMGAGAAQTMMNIHKVLPGERIIMIGSGNVGLIVSYQLKQAGAKVLGVIEVLPEVSGYNVHAAKIRRAGIPILTSRMIKKAIGKKFLESVIIAEVDENFDCIDGMEIQINCDLLCIATGLQPFNELCWSLKMEMKYSAPLGGFLPVHDENQETSIEGIFVAGDVAGIEEASTAMDEGRLAGLIVAKKLDCIGGNEYEELRAGILNSLKELRMGSFGSSRQKEKEILIKNCNSWRSK